MAQDGPRRDPRISYSMRAAPFWAHLGLSWALLGPPWPFSEGPKGHLEALLGLGRLDLGVKGGKELRCQTHQNTIGKSMFLVGFWEQAAFRKLARCFLGGLAVGLKA